MKKHNILIALVGMLAVPALQAAVSVGSSGTITLSTGPNSVGVGGEFVATGFGGLSDLGTFSSFCLEHNEYFNPGGTYNAAVNTAAVSGGVSTSGSPGSDPLSMGTAWLYSQFRAGTLGGYTGAATAGQLQNAIWWLEGEIAADQSANPFISLIPDASWRDYNSKVDANGAFGVVALNLNYRNTDGSNGRRAQDQLAIVPVPEPTTIIAGALLLLPFAVSTIRRSRKS